MKWEDGKSTPLKRIVKRLRRGDLRIHLSAITEENQMCSITHRSELYVKFVPMRTALW